MALTRPINRGIQSYSNTTFTRTEPFYSCYWWPCKQSLTDKIDSADIWITVPDSVKAPSVGALQNITPVAPGFVRYEWKTTYPTAYYLLTIAAANYHEFSHYMHFDGSPDSMMMQYFLTNKPIAISNFMGYYDSLAWAVNRFSEYFGRYPFWKEKYGEFYGGSMGGMEFQTMSRIGNPPVHVLSNISIHELAHQWFGDHVTCGTWKDIWLNEGWATYCENIYQELVYPASQISLEWHFRHSSLVTSTAAQQSLHRIDTGSVAYPDVIHGYVYEKGASVLRMLRHIAPNDSVFFAATRFYLSTFGGKTAVTSDFQQIFETAYGRSLDTFFNQWVYQKGYPIYQIKWNQTSTQTIIQVIQTTTDSSVTCFNMPLDIKFSSLSGDTIVSIYNNQNVQTFVYNWSKPLNLAVPFEVDPNNYIPNKILPPIKDTTLSIPAASLKQNIEVYPNPTSTTWTIINIPGNCKLTLLDQQGSVLWNARTTNTSERLPELGLATGIYILKVEIVNGELFYKKLLKE